MDSLGNGGEKVINNTKHKKKGSSNYTPKKIGDTSKKIPNAKEVAEGYGAELVSDKRIDKIKISDAKEFLIMLQEQKGRSYSSIHNIRGVLRPAFQMAYEDMLIRKNPFEFQLHTVVVNDSVKRDALTRKQERQFLKFISEDEHYSQYYEVFYILFNTGMRISEFCGLTIKDIDFKEKTLNISKQLQYVGKVGGYIEETKTTAGKG